MPDHIELRGVRVHNLKDLDLDIPLHKLTVVTGVSGAGKSSLAFGTVYAEGQRRYVQSFSAYARRFLEQLEPPDADRIGFLPATVAIRPTTSSAASRSTVGTVSETANDLQLVFARLGTIVCPDCNLTVRSDTSVSAAKSLETLPPGIRLQVAFSWRNAIAPLQQAGFSRAVIDGRTCDLNAAPQFPPNSDVLVIVDRLTSGRAKPERLLDSLETAFDYGAGQCVVLADAHSDLPPLTKGGGGGGVQSASPVPIDGRSWHGLRLSTDPRCPRCGTLFAIPEQRLFSFQSALGACPTCRGLGTTVEAPSRRRTTCPACRGTRFQPQTLAVRLAGEHIAQWTSRSVHDVRGRLAGWIATLSPDELSPIAPVLPRLTRRLEALEQLGLGYLTLDRAASSLSTGEARRLHLMAAATSQLVNTLYVIDEPTAGLHPSETDSVLKTLLQLRDAGNTLLVIEHNPAVIARADLQIDLGPAAGPDGGRVVFCGPPRESAVGTPESGVRGQESGGNLQRGFAHSVAEAARFGEENIDSQETVTPPDPPRPPRRTPTGFLTLAGIEHRNLHDLTVSFPLGVLCLVTGTSGSGKSSLVCETLFPAVQAKLKPQSAAVNGTGGIGTFLELSGAEALQDVVLIDQRPLPRRARSTPGTLLGVMSAIRGLFAQSPDAQVRNYSPLHFSFNADTEGRCPTCAGLGELQIDLQFLPDVKLTCPDCRGLRFRREVLDVKYRGLSIADVLSLSVRDAFAFFRGQPRLQKRLKSLKDVGLDYLTLGRAASTLSTGETQRLKLAANLLRSTRTRTLFLLDEPAIGLHAADVARLLDVFDLMLASGHSILAISHHPALLQAADHVVELSPGQSKSPRDLS